MTTYSTTGYAPASAATTADYADALLTARRAKTTLFVLLLLLILGQLTLFFLARYDVINLGIPAQRVPASVQDAGDAIGDAAGRAGDAIGRGADRAAQGTKEAVRRATGESPADAATETDPAVTDPAVTVTPAVEPAADPLSAENEVKAVVGRVGDPADAASADAASADAASAGLSNDTAGLVAYALGFTTFLGLVFAVVLTLTVLLILLIILNSRAYGASAVTSAFCWMIFLLVLIFPWYAFLNYGGSTGGAAGFRIPGVLYTWPELLAGVRFPDDFSSAGASAETILKWARFVAFPLLALVLLVMVQSKSGRGVREALGEADVRRVDGVVVEEERVNV